MIKEIKAFFKSYKTEVAGYNRKWLKKHWKGMTVLSTVLFLIASIIIFIWYLATWGLSIIDVLPENLVNKFQKKSEE